MFLADQKLNNLHTVLLPIDGTSTYMHIIHFVMGILWDRQWSPPTIVIFPLFLTFSTPRTPNCMTWGSYVIPSVFPGNSQCMSLFITVTTCLRITASLLIIRLAVRGETISLALKLVFYVLIYSLIVKTRLTGIIQSWMVPLYNVRGRWG